MPISGVVLEVGAGTEREVANSFIDVRGIEVQQIGINHLILTTDTARAEEDRALTEALERWPGVLSAKVVFTNMEDCID
ncbi:chaperone NapD [Halobacteriovorax sp. HLS]|uniref:chaperone NapD n=1 Tax=Halobacteriovorax sp. HLS TaxID=2234000 RepID=UPI0013E3F253|nr:chaperone NapD [Halobacteriovorax sp. HLS]